MRLTWTLSLSSNPDSEGGVVNANDALEFILVGASAVGVGTGLFYEPLICPSINQGISDYLSNNELSNIDELVGTLRLN